MIDTIKIVLTGFKIKNHNLFKSYRSKPKMFLRGIKERNKNKKQRLKQCQKENKNA